MPVTAKLSKAFYDKLGEEVANELVNWFNAVDANYRADLRELNELNFARFTATMGQRFAEQDARMERGFAGMIKWMFIFWVGNVATTIGVVAVALRLGR